MLREEVISQWSGLKEKINDLKFSQKDQEVIDYFSNASCLFNFIPSSISNENEDELTKWEKEVQIFYERTANFNPDNDWITDYLLFVSALANTIRDWISKVRKIQSLRNNGFDIEEVD